MADLNELTAQEIGRRLRLAREKAKIRQDEARAHFRAQRASGKAAVDEKVLLARTAAGRHS